MINRRGFVTVTAGSAAGIALTNIGTDMQHAHGSTDDKKDGHKMSSGKEDGQAGIEIGDYMPTQGQKVASSLPQNEPASKFRPKHKFGIGGVAIGNAFAPMSDELAYRTMETAWENGVRFFDTSPWYGLGLSERRMGLYLKNHAKEEYVLSTKIGRVLKATSEPPKTMWHQASPFAYQYDYSADGTRRSIEDSLQRLGISQIDVVFIHDLSPDNGDMGARWIEYFDEAAKGAMPELTRMREEGIIKAWGFGVNRPEPALKAIEVADPDIFLLACQYSLIDHEEAVEKTLPKLEEKGVSVVVGAPLMAGYLAGRERYLYAGTIPPGAAEKRKKLSSVAERHGVDLKTASLQFAAAPKVVSSVIPGVRTPAQVTSNVDAMKTLIPDDFWNELKENGLISKQAATPKFVKAENQKSSK